MVMLCKENLTATMSEMMPRNGPTSGQDRTDQERIERTISPRQGFLLPCGGVL